MQDDLNRAHSPLHWTMSGAGCSQNNVQPEGVTSLLLQQGLDNILCKYCRIYSLVGIWE